MVSDQNLTRRNQERSPLLRLPPELRDRVYNLALGGHTIDIPYLRPGMGNEDWHIREAALHYTCRQIRHETMNKHFALNTFASENIAWCFSPGFIARHEGLKHVRTVQMMLLIGNVWEDEGGPYLILPRELGGLRELKDLESIIIEGYTADNRAVRAVRRELEQGAWAAQNVSVTVTKDRPHTWVFTAEDLIKALDEDSAGP